MNRRHVLAGAGAFGLASLSGCLGLAGLDEHEATPGGVEGDTREETGYEQAAIEESVGAGPVSETVRVQNYLTEHEKTVDMGPLGEQRGAVFILLTTPQIGIPGYQFNPVEDMSTRELVELVASNYEGLGDVEHQSDGSETVLGQSTTVSRFEASAQFDGQDIDVDLHVSAAVETEEDLLVTIGVYPQPVRAEEEENVTDLMAGVVETADESASETGEEGNGGDGSGDDGFSDGDGSNGDDEGDDGGLI